MKDVLDRSDHEFSSPRLAKSSKEDTHRLHCYTVTENERVLTAEFPLQCQHDNERSCQMGRSHDAISVCAWRSCNRRSSNSRMKASARLMTSAPASCASSTL